uniref:Uncharacterized protein n=1 Tax=Romanomermis culicivorax TaxID=13658 RepID=A0A915JY18_ROMCU
MQIRIAGNCRGGCGFPGDGSCCGSHVGQGDHHGHRSKRSEIGGIAAIVGGIPSARRRRRGEDEVKVCECSSGGGFTLGGGSCVLIKEGRSEGNPVGSNGLSGSKFHRADKFCQRSMGTGPSVSLW